MCLDGKYGYIDKNGEIALPFLYDQASPFREGTAYFSCGKEYGLIDREGAVVLRLENCDSISSFREGLAYFCRDGFYGYMDQSGRVVIPPVYDDAGYFYDGLASVRKGGFFGLIDKDGREVLAPQYSSIRRDDLYGLTDGNGNLVLEPVYEQIVPVAGKELAIAYNENGESGILDYAGQVRVPFIYSSIYADGGDVYILRDGRAEVEISFMSYNQTTGNYSDTELLEDAELFYDQEDIPYTQDTILEAGYVREYLIEGQRVPVEEFRALEERYQYQYYLTPEW